MLLFLPVALVVSSTKCIRVVSVVALQGGNLGTGHHADALRTIVNIACNLFFLLSIRYPMRSALSPFRPPPAGGRGRA